MFQYSDKYRFTEQWFDPMIPHWEDVFNNYYDKEKIKDVLEVGCYEGRATIFLCENILQDGVNYDVVDTFGGTLEEWGMWQAAELFDQDKDFLENNFKHNISFHPQVNFNIHKGYSQYVLPVLAQQGKQYDFIYIDASHRADDTFVDAYYANKMLKSGGLIIFDDFGWKDSNLPHPVQSPELGIITFSAMYNNLYSQILGGYQVGAIKA